MFLKVDWYKKEHHLLGYFPDSAWDGELSPPLRLLQAEVAKVCVDKRFFLTVAFNLLLSPFQVKDSREKRNEMMIEFLNELLQSTKGE